MGLWIGTLFKIDPMEPGAVPEPIPAKEAAE